MFVYICVYNDNGDKNGRRHGSHACARISGNLPDATAAALAWHSSASSSGTPSPQVTLTGTAPTPGPLSLAIEARPPVAQEIQAPEDLGTLRFPCNVAWPFS